MVKEGSLGPFQIPRCCVDISARCQSRRVHVIKHAERFELNARKRLKFEPFLGPVTRMVKLVNNIDCVLWGLI